MSYDIMVIDRHERFVKVKDFEAWFDKTTQWDEPLDYNDPSHATQRLQAWYEKMRETVPPMNGPYASEDNPDIAADYSIARDAIYVAMSWEHAKEQRVTAWRLAMQLGLAFFDISGTSCVYYPDGWKLLCTGKQKQIEEAEEEYNKSEKHLVNIFIVCFLLLCLLCITYFTGSKELNTIQIVVTLLTFAVIGVDGWLLSAAKKKRDKRLAEIENEGEKKVDIDVYYPTFMIPDQTLKSIIRSVPSTRVILYDYIKDHSISKEWKEWAFSMMETGYNTDGIVQLAGEDLSMNPFEFKELASRIFNELGICVSPQLAYEQYILWIANQVDHGELSAKEGFQILYEAAVDSEYDDAFMAFYQLNDTFGILVDQNGYSEDVLERMRRDVFMNYLMQNGSDSH